MESSCVVHLYKPEWYSSADCITNVLVLPTEWISNPEFAMSCSSSLYQQTWASGSDTTHWSTIGHPASINLVLMSSGIDENFIGGAIDIFRFYVNLKSNSCEPFRLFIIIYSLTTTVLTCFDIVRDKLHI